MPRNYDNQPVKKVTTPLLHCQLCSKKYKVEKKLQQHVEQQHYFETRNGNYFVLNRNSRAKIYGLAEDYLAFLTRINTVSEEELSGRSINLLPQLYNTAIANE